MTEILPRGAAALDSPRQRQAANPEKTAEMVFALDDALGADDNYAFDAQFGFLTSCPSP